MNINKSFFEQSAHYTPDWFFIIAPVKLGILSHSSGSDKLKSISPLYTRGIYIKTERAARIDTITFTAYLLQIELKRLLKFYGFLMVN